MRKTCRPIELVVIVALLAVSACSKSTAVGRSTTSTLSSTAPGGGASSASTEEDDLGGTGAPTAPGTIVRPGSGSAAGGSACRPGNPLANVYHPNRLTVVDQCMTVSGQVMSVRSEPDGDIHFDLQLDPQFSGLLKPGNFSVQHGWLVDEIVPADEPGCTPGQPPRPAAGTYDYGLCTGADENAPAVGSHVYVTGPYVLDQDHGGWAEIHPVWALSTVAPGSTPSTTTTVPAAAAPTAGSCSASVSNPAPSVGGQETVSVTSDLPDTTGTVTAHYKTTTHPFPIQTDASGNAQVTFSTGHPTAGYTVEVTVDLSGKATCSTSFTPR